MHFFGFSPFFFFSNFIDNIIATPPPPDKECYVSRRQFVNVCLFRIWCCCCCCCCKRNSNHIHYRVETQNHTIWFLHSGCFIGIGLGSVCCLAPPPNVSSESGVVIVTTCYLVRTYACVYVPTRLQSVYYSISNAFVSACTSMVSSAAYQRATLSKQAYVGNVYLFRIFFFEGKLCWP